MIPLFIVNLFYWYVKSLLKKRQDGGTQVAQSVEHLTLDISSSHDLRVMGSSPESGSALSKESA